MQRQEQTFWCWAAVSSSVAHLFAAASWSQCAIASALFAASGWDCCGSDASAAARCNQPWYLDRALAQIGCLDRYVPAMTSFQDVQAEIEAGRPLGCHIAWAGGNGHFVAIAGCSISADGVAYVRIEDPYFGSVQKTFSGFCNAYRLAGDRWTASYFVKTPSMSAQGGGISTISSPKNA